MLEEEILNLSDTMNAIFFSYMYPSGGSHLGHFFEGVTLLFSMASEENMETKMILFSLITCVFCPTLDEKCYGKCSTFQ